MPSSAAVHLSTICLSGGGCLLPITTASDSPSYRATTEPPRWTRHAVSGESRSGVSGGVIPGPRTHRPAPLGRGARDIAGSDVGPSLVLVLGWACRVVGLGECRRQFVFVLFVVYDGLVVPGGFADSGVIGSSANSPDSPKTACYCVSRDVDMMFLRA